MGSLGFPEMMMVFFIALILFGPKKLPEIGRTIGKALAEFKKATSDLKRTLDEEIRIDEHKRMLTDTRQAINNLTSIPANPPAVTPSPAVTPAAQESEPPVAIQ